MNRRIAATDVSATHTKPQMHPFVIIFAAFFAAVFASRIKNGYLVGVLARF